MFELESGDSLVRLLVVLAGVVLLGPYILIQSRRLAIPYKTTSTWSARTAGVSVALMSIAFAFLSLKYVNLLTLGLMMILTANLVLLSLLDARLKVLPNKLTLPLLVAGLLLSLTGYTVPWLDAVLGMICGFLILYLPALIYSKLRGRSGVGFGDIKLMAAVGAWLGWQPILHIIFVAGLSAALFGAAYLHIKQRPKTEKIPFGPFLAITTIVYMLI